jgi:non-homologous end joining protein Ku
VVAAALEGKPAPQRAAAPRLAPVVDLMQSLKASLEKQGEGARKPPANRKKAPQTASPRGRKRTAA